MQVNGACHCKRISFSAEIDLDRVVLCHCTDCQIMFGGPYRSVRRKTGYRGCEQACAVS